MYPYILISLALTLIFALCCHGAIRKHSGMFYALAVVLVVAEVVYYVGGVYEMAPEWLTDYVVNLFKRGALSTAMFVVVMYAGALDARRPMVRRLMGVRGPLSIIACLLTLGHNIIYGGKHFVALFTNPGEMKPQTLAAALISVVMIALMIPLMVTSFQAVRGKMKFRGWKRLQRLAYAFFALIYIHVMVLFVPKFPTKWVDVLAYTVIFGVYLILRVAKAMKSKGQKPVGCGCASK